MADKPLTPVSVSPTWEAEARSGLSAHGKGMRRLNRKLFREMLTQLAEGMPLDTVSRYHGFNPEAIRAYKASRPGLWDIIERARSAGEMKALRTIAESPQWQAQDRLLQLQREDYAPKGPAGQGAPSIAINLTIESPRPELPAPIDAVTTILDIEESPALPAPGKSEP